MLLDGDDVLESSVADLFGDEFELETVPESDADVAVEQLIGLESDDVDESEQVDEQEADEALSHIDLLELIDDNEADVLEEDTVLVESDVTDDMTWLPGSSEAA